MMSSRVLYTMWTVQAQRCNLEAPYLSRVGSDCEPSMITYWYRPSDSNHLVAVQETSNRFQTCIKEHRDRPCRRMLSLTVWWWHHLQYPKHNVYRLGLEVTQFLGCDFHDIGPLSGCEKGICSKVFVNWFETTRPNTWLQNGKFEIGLFLKLSASKDGLLKVGWI